MGGVGSGAFSIESALQLEFELKMCISSGMEDWIRCFRYPIIFWSQRWHLVVTSIALVVDCVFVVSFDSRLEGNSFAGEGIWQVLFFFGPGSQIHLRDGVSISARNSGIPTNTNRFISGYKFPVKSARLLTQFRPVEVKPISEWYRYRPGYHR